MHTNVGLGMTYSCILFLPFRLTDMNKQLEGSGAKRRQKVSNLIMMVCLLSLVVGACAMDEKFSYLNKVGDTLGPPKRPAKFRTVKELQDYLGSLREYYSVISRPR